MSARDEHAAKSAEEHHKAYGMEYALVGWGEYMAALLPETYAKYCKAYDLVFDKLTGYVEDACGVGGDERQERVVA